MPYHLKQFYKNIMPRGLFGRSLLIIVLPLLLTMMIATFVFFDRHWSTTTERLTNSLAGEISMITEQVRVSDEEEKIISLIEKAVRDLGFFITYYPNQIFDSSQAEIGFYVLEKPLTTALNDKRVKRYSLRPYTDEENKSWIEITVAVGEEKGILEFQIPEKRIFSSTTYIFLLAMLGGGFFLMGIAIIFMRNQVRPVKRLAMAAEKLGKGEDVTRFKPEGAREVRQAANAFLVMRERIKRQVRQRTDMLAGVSHDLRTPLTRLKLQLAMFDQNEDILAMQQDLTSMEKMIDGYLAFARGDDDEETTSVNIKELLDECVEKAKRHDQTIYFDTQDASHTLRLREQAIKRLFNNLIANAGKYAKSCWVSVNPLPSALEIWVEDDGPGIPKEKYEDVFKPFYRLDESRNVDEGGVGLGLSIARDIAMSHGGDIRLEKSSHQGLKVVVRLPL